MDCSACKDVPKQIMIPYVVHESEMARNERNMKRIFCVLVAILILWFSTIGVFVWYLNQYDFESYDVEVSTDDGGDANYIGGDGTIFGGSGRR